MLYAPPLILAANGLVAVSKILSQRF